MLPQGKIKGCFGLRKLLVRYGLHSPRAERAAPDPAGPAVPAQGILSWSPRRGINPTSLRGKGIWGSSEAGADRRGLQQAKAACHPPALPQRGGHSPVLLQSSLHAVAQQELGLLQSPCQTLTLLGLTSTSGTSYSLPCQLNEMGGNSL